MATRKSKCSQTGDLNLQEGAIFSRSLNDNRRVIVTGLYFIRFSTQNVTSRSVLIFVKSSYIEIGAVVNRTGAWRGAEIRPWVRGCESRRCLRRDELSSASGLRLWAARRRTAVDFVGGNFCWFRRILCPSQFEIIWVCESPAIILYSGVLKA